MFELLSHDAAHGLGRGQAAGKVANDEVGEPVDAVHGFDQ